MKSEYSSAELRYILVATCVASITTPLMSTMMNLSLLDIGAEFGVGSHDQAYVNTMFLLGSVFWMAPAAKLASIHGMRKVFVAGLAMMAVACVLSSLSPTFYFLILMRFLIGVAAAMLAVTSVAMLSYVFPVSNRGRVLGINTTFVYVGLSVGPTIGGIITDLAGWRYIFVLIFVIALVSLLLSAKFTREIVPTPDQPMDWKGAAQWGVMIIILMMGFINITTFWGPYLAAFGIVMLVSTWLYLRSVENPILNSRMFRNKVFSRSCIAAFMNYGASYCITFFLSLYLQSIGQLTATQAGGLMLVQPLMQVFLTAKMGSVSDRMSDKRILPAVGMAITGAGVAMYWLLGTEYSLALVLCIMVVTGIGLGIFSAPNNSLIMSSVESDMKGEAAGVLAVVRQTGMMISMSLAMAMISVIMGSTDNLGPATFGSFVDVIHYTFAVCFAMCVVGVVCSLIKVKGNLELN